MAIARCTDTQQATDRLHILSYIERIIWSQPVQLSVDNAVLRYS
ncbi:MAG: hypothetical protein ACFB14_21805 [Leptolyngbyaceae cyanobacterium]